MSFQRRKIIHVLQERGCRFLREGSRHTIFVTDAGRQVQVPRHHEVRRGTVRSIAKQAGIDWHEFEKAVS